MKSDTSIQCRLTGAVGPPVRAHIIPESFYLLSGQARDKLKLVSNFADDHPKRCPIGVYDNTILTREGESYFRKSDHYAFDLLVTQWPSAVPHSHSGKLICYVHEEYDYRLLKLFFLSVLWRAGVSSQPFFAKVQLGPHADRLKDHILRNDPGDADTYSVVLAVFDEFMELPKIINPFPLRDRNGILWYRICLGNFIAEIKVDKRHSPQYVREAQLTPSRPLIIIQQDFATSNERMVLAMLLDKMRGQQTAGAHTPPT